MRRGHDLAPHVLPDAALGRVPDPSALQALLAAQLRARVAGVKDAEHEMVGPRAQRLGDVRREGQVAAHVLADGDAVDKDGAGPVHGLEVQYEPLVRGELGGVERPPVPEQLARLELPSHAGERRLGREGHADGLPPSRRGRGGPPGASGVRRKDECALPDSVERGPCVARQLRAGVRGGRRVLLARRDPLSPRRQKRRELDVFGLPGLARENALDVEHGHPLPARR